LAQSRHHQLQRAPSAKHPAKHAIRAAHAPAAGWAALGLEAVAPEAPGSAVAAAANGEMW
jgi:hypothetical protein